MAARMYGEAIGEGTGEEPGLLREEEEEKEEEGRNGRRCPAWWRTWWTSAELVPGPPHVQERGCDP